MYDRAAESSEMKAGAPSGLDSELEPQTENGEQVAQVPGEGSAGQGDKGEEWKN